MNERGEAETPTVGESSSGVTPLRHVSVLMEATLAGLDPQPGEIWLDATVGAGGHSLRIAQAIAPTGRLIGIDQDERMLAGAKPRLAGLPVSLYIANFDQFPAVLERAGVSAVDGVLADLGFCSDQLDSAERGLSFRQDGPLDMRLSAELGETAADLVARLDERALADLFWEYGEERHSRRIARRIVERRTTTPIRTTSALADLVRSCVPRERRDHGRGGAGLDPATRVFQALRIAVNDELGALERLLAELPRWVKPGGRVGIISFHSLEDRRVKQAFRNGEIWQERTRKPIQADDAEMRQNSRSRSAKLRVAMRQPADSPG
ncbi:16S rRNA (cytosine(1402)-N(4))-methyltransferase RsmH [Tuwongella immobilis]|nr:16S rRNA (cytosine(1402)-N(4))-methyltransferase RsmH [Tuwongella immobilis]